MIPKSDLRKGVAARDQILAIKDLCSAVVVESREQTWLPQLTCHREVIFVTHKAKVQVKNRCCLF